MKRRYLWMIALPVLLFAALAALIVLERTTGLEGAVYTWLAGAMSPALTAAAKAVTWLCNPPTVAVFCLLLLVFPPTLRTIALPVAASAAGSALLNQLLKHAFGRERPNILRLVAETSASFPSGHSMTSTAVCTTLLLLALHYFRNRVIRWAAALALGLLPVLIGLSRIYLGVHHAGDVLGGWLLGAAVGTAVFAAWERWFMERWGQKRRNRGAR